MQTKHLLGTDETGRASERIALVLSQWLRVGAADRLVA